MVSGFGICGVCGLLRGWGFWEFEGVGGLGGFGCGGARLVYVVALGGREVRCADLARWSRVRTRTVLQRPHALPLRPPPRGAMLSPAHANGGNFLLSESICCRC